MMMAEKMKKAEIFMIGCHAIGIEWISPTAVGEHVGKLAGLGDWKHSSYGSPICKKLVETGVAERNSVGHYRIS